MTEQVLRSFIPYSDPAISAAAEELYQLFMTPSDREERAYAMVIDGVNARRSFPERKKFTPPEVGKRYGVAPEKVIAWIRRGELRAINIASQRGRRFRFLIDEADLQAFERARAVTQAPAQSRWRRPKDPDYTEYF